MPITLIDKIKQKSGDFKLLDAVDIDWTGFKIPATNITLPDNVATDAEVDSKLQNRPTTDQMNSAIQQAIGKVDHLRRVVLDKGASLPDSSQDKNTIYMKPESDGSYSEWFWVVGSDGRGKWEEIGSSRVDLSGYLTKTEAGNTYAKKTDLNNYTTTTVLQQTYATKQEVTNNITTALQDDGAIGQKIIAAKQAAITEAGKLANQAQTTAENTATQKANAAKDAAIADAAKKYLPLTGGTVSGAVLTTPGHSFTNDNELVSKKYVDAAVVGASPQDMLSVQDFKTGSTRGTFKVKEQEVAIAGLNTMAYEDKTNYLTKDKLTWQTF